MQTNTGEWLGRQWSAARRELKTEASWVEFSEWNIGERAARQNPTLEMSERGGAAWFKHPRHEKPEGALQKC